MRGPRISASGWSASPALLEELLDTATTRAREIAGIIADTSNESVQTIEQQYELVRKTSEEERQRTSEALNAVYEEASAEVQAMFNQSAGRFTEIMQGMKQMAAEMQQELETTRAELRRGILELPQETAESAAQMRRVIVDQIEALGRAQSHRRPPWPFARCRRTGAARSRAALRRQRRPRPGPRPVRADMPPPAPRRRNSPAATSPARRAGRGGPPNLSPVPGGKDDSATPATAAGCPTFSPAPRATKARRSRRSHRASRRLATEQRAAAARRVDSIDTLSVDIARMIDHDAAAELWERYKRGERGAFTRRLYTPQGQKAFDEIRNKYRTDPEFRQTVEHYIHEFERLLDDVSRGDRGPTVARNYLTSDTGKVYTMLAHAAGRFD